MTYAVVEKKNRQALHGLFDTKERAERHLTVTIPVYVTRSYFMDKTLTAESFEVIEYPKGDRTSSSVRAHVLP